MIKMTATVATGLGTTGTVDASVTAAPWGVKGELHSAYFNFDSSVTSVTNVTIATDAGVLFTLSNSNSDSWYYPRDNPHNASGVAYATGSPLVMFPITEGTMRVSVSSSTPSVDALTAYLYIKEQ